MLLFFLTLLTEERRMAIIVKLNF